MNKQLIEDSQQSNQVNQEMLVWNKRKLDRQSRMNDRFAKLKQKTNKIKNQPYVYEIEYQNEELQVQTIRESKQMNHSEYEKDKALTFYLDEDQNCNLKIEQDKQKDENSNSFSFDRNGNNYHKFIESMFKGINHHKQDTEDENINNNQNFIDKIHTSPIDKKNQIQSSLQSQINKIPLLNYIGSSNEAFEADDQDQMSNNCSNSSNKKLTLVSGDQKQMVSNNICSN